MTTERKIKFDTIICSMSDTRRIDWSDPDSAEPEEWPWDMPVQVTVRGDQVLEVLYKGKAILEFVDWQEQMFLLEVAQIPKSKRTDLVELGRLRYRMVSEELDEGLVGRMATRVGKSCILEKKEDASRDWVENVFEDNSLLGLLRDVFEALGKGADVRKALTPFHAGIREEMRKWMDDYCAGAEAGDSKYDKIQKLKETFDSLLEELEDL